MGAKNPNCTPFVLYDGEVDTDRAPEPSDIIWENLNITSTTIHLNEAKSYAIIGIFLFLTFILFTFMKAFSGANAKKYPDSIDCKSIQSLYGTHSNKKVTFTDA
jgi:hypothetical protein